MNVATSYTRDAVQSEVPMLVQSPNEHRDTCSGNHASKSCLSMSFMPIVALNANPDFLYLSKYIYIYTHTHMCVCVYSACIHTRSRQA